MIITTAQLTDLHAIEALRRETFGYFAPSHYNPIEVENLLADFDSEQAATMIEQRTFFVAKDADKVAACAAWHGHNIRHVYVDPNLTMRGLGRRILTFAEIDFQQRTGRHEIAASVIIYAKGFYEKNGYRVLSQERDWDGSAYFKMCKLLLP